MVAAVPAGDSGVEGWTRLAEILKVKARLASKGEAVDFSAWTLPWGAGEYRRRAADARTCRYPGTAERGCFAAKRLVPEKSGNRQPPRSRIKP